MRTSPQSGIKSSFETALICTTSHRIPASAGTNRGPERGDLRAVRRKDLLDAAEGEEDRDGEVGVSRVGWDHARKP